MVRLWFVSPRTIQDGLVVCVPFRGGTNRGGGCVELSALRIALLRVMVHVIVRPWCVPSRTICGGLMGLGVPFREGTNRGMGVECVSFREDTNRGVSVSCNHAKWIALVRVVVCVMGRLWCVPSRTIHGGLMGLGVPFRGGTNRGVSVSCNQVKRIALVRVIMWLWYGFGACLHAPN